jgi:hypothetical protein
MAMGKPKQQQEAFMLEANAAMIVRRDTGEDWKEYVPRLMKEEGPSKRTTNRRGMRRSWLRGLADVTKRYLIATAAHNLGRILRKLFGVGKPMVLQGSGGVDALMQFAIRWPLAILAVLMHWFASHRIQSTAIGCK